MIESMVENDLKTSRPELSNSIAVVIPYLNEELTIGEVIKDFKKVLPTATIHVWDNGSTDRTAMMAEEAGAIVHSDQRRGKGRMVREAFKTLDDDVLLLVDGDATYPAGPAVSMVQAILDNKADMVVGDRLATTYYQENDRRFHGIGNKMVRDSIRLLFHAHVDDVMSGCRAFSRRFYKNCPILSNGFQVETELTVHAVDNDFKIMEIPIDYKNRPSGSHSKLKTIPDGVRVLSTIFHMVEERRPLPFFGSLGTIIAFIGLLLDDGVLTEYWQTGMVPRFPTLIGGSMMIMIGLLLWVVGLVLDVIARNEKRRLLLRVMNS